MVSYKKSVLAVMIAVSLAITLSACGATSATGSKPKGVDIQAPAEPKAVASPAPTVPSAPPSLFVGTANVTTKDGYTFTVKYDFSLGNQFVKSVVKEKPGFSAITGAPTAAIAITNTTPGRVLNFNVISFGTSPGSRFAGMFQVAGIFPANSPVCKLVEGGYGPPPPTASALLWRPATGCAYVYVDAPVGPDGTGNAVLNSGESRNLSGFGSVADITTYGDEYAQNIGRSSGQMIVAHVSDADYPVVLSALSAPPKLVLAVAGGSLVQPSLSCQVIASSDGAAGC